MNLAIGISTYLTLNILIVFGVAILALSNELCIRKQLTLNSKNKLKLHYFTIIVITLITTIYPWLPRNKIFEPIAKVWSAPSIRIFSNQTLLSSDGVRGYFGFDGQNPSSLVETQTLSIILITLLLITLIAGFLQIYRDLQKLLHIKKQSYLIRKQNNCLILLNQNIQVPFSFYYFGRAYIIMPSRLVEDRQSYQIALAHEIQHHRQGDTKWLYLIWILQLICIINPLIHYWSRWISEIQEFACDETLVDRNKVNPQAYARCLFEVAQTAISKEGIPVCATGLVFLTDRNLLKRRIEKMLNRNLKKSNRLAAVITGLVLTSSLTLTALASTNIVHDRRVSMAKAKEMAANTSNNSEFPIVVNDLVLKQLNRYIGTPEGRSFMRKALHNMENYRQLVTEKLGQYDMPKEIMAIPIIESGYQNIPQDGAHAHWGAGIWMFIKSTAKKFGLRVDEQVDERLNVELLTDAAMRYLKSNQLLFKDWHLAILAYNVGEREVRRALDATGTKDAWSLIRTGVENDPDYLPRAMAAIIIMYNPDSVEQ